MKFRQLLLSGQKPEFQASMQQASSFDLKANQVVVHNLLKFHTEDQKAIRAKTKARQPDQLPVTQLLQPQRSNV